MSVKQKHKEFSKKDISIILPINNEEAVLQKNCLALFQFLKKDKNIRNFEILLCDNGSSDKSLAIAKSLEKKYKQHKQIRAFHSPKRGLGIGIQLGIDNARYDNLFFYAIDIPFGFDIIDQSLAALESADVVIGSKGHPKSIIKRSISRRMYSKMLNTALLLLFRLNVKDTQGSIMFRKSDVKKFRKSLDSDTAFLQTQIILYSKKHGSKIKEIPIRFIQKSSKTRMKPFKDGLRMAKELIKERARM